MRPLSPIQEGHPARVALQGPLLDCTTCGESKPASSFSPDARCTRRHGRTSVCTPCRTARQRRSHVQNPERRRSVYRKHHLKTKYGITPEQYDALLEAQDGCCAICGQPEAISTWNGQPRLAVDHDHATGEIRGLLCNHCNTGLGKFRDDPDVLDAAIDYLRQERG